MFVEVCGCGRHCVCGCVGVREWVWMNRHVNACLNSVKEPG